jgi:hypothetical protein
MERKIKRREVKRKENSMVMVGHRKKTKSRLFVNTTFEYWNFLT